MKRLIFVFAWVFLTGAGQVYAQSNRSADAVVTIGPDESGNWLVEYSFAEPQQLLAFVQSGNDYRAATWTVSSGNANLARAAGLDVIVLDQPARKVAFSVIPLTSELQGEATPFMTFRDGAIAVHEGQFRLFPVTRSEILGDDGERLPDPDTAQLAMDTRISSDRNIIADGEVHQGTLTNRIEDGGTYIYIGKGEIRSFEHFNAVLDATFPAWIGERFMDSVLERIFAAHEARWGRALDKKPTVMFAYKGERAGGLSVKGGAADDMLMVSAGGARLNEPDSDTLAYLHWYFAHEAAHLFQSEGGVRFAGEGDAWIHEGAANMMAYTQIAATLNDEAGPRFLASVYGGAFEECVSALEGGPLASARERGVNSAHYACGDFVALATDGFLRRRDIYSFWNTLIERALDMESPRVDAGLYFNTLQLLGATEGQRSLIQAIVGDEAPENPRKALIAMLEAAKLAPQFNAEGQLISMDWPDYSAE